MGNNNKSIIKRLLAGLTTAGFVCMAGVPGLSAFAAVTPHTTLISNLPLQLVIPAHPQVLIAVGNSQSMDGNLSGAIMTGSGRLSGLENSSAPKKYIVKKGFTPPLEGADAEGKASYTVAKTFPAPTNEDPNNTKTVLYDNSPSRLNLAKASIKAVLQDYADRTDFGLMDYSTSGAKSYDTWVYYMSNPGGFTFTSDPNDGNVAQNSKILANPCYQSDSAICKNIDNHYADVNVLEQPYLIVANSSDEPEINDVLYAGGQSDIFLSWGKRDHDTPYPPNFYLNAYNNGKVLIKYSKSINSGAPQTGPTNAGFVPYSSEVMYARRGFGYYDGGVNQKAGNLLVPIASVGDHPTQADIDNYVAKFTPYLAPETNKAATKEIKAGAPQSPLAGILNGAYNYYTGPNPPPSSNGCGALRYVVLMTDGLPTEDLSGRNWPPLGSTAARGYGVTAMFNSDGSLANTNDQALQDAINELSQLKKAGIKTYVVGLGAGVAKSTNPEAYATLQAMALAGGTGKFFPATSPAAVADDLQVIITQIEEANLSLAAVAANSTSLREGAAIYQARFVSKDSTGNWQWTGNLSALPIDKDGVVTNNNAKWQAQQLLDDQDYWGNGRLIATYDPKHRKGIPFRWTPHAAHKRDYINKYTALGQALMAPGDPDRLNDADADVPAEARLEYLRGERVDEEANGGPFRDRPHILGDIVNSEPLYVGPPRGYSSNRGYNKFLKAHASRSAVIYVGANDGMLHAFDAKTGKERFAFIPHGVFDNLIELTEPAYNDQHRYFVDGSPVAADVRFDGSWHTILVGGLGNGGKSIYALDVTDPDAIDSEQKLAQHVLWEFTDDKLGKTYSQPVIAKINDDGKARWVVIFGSGYNNGDGKPYLYVVDAENGSLLKKIDLCRGDSQACDSSLPNGASSPTVVSRRGSTVADTVYIGDLQGNLWRVDLSDKHPDKWKDILLFKAEYKEGDAQPVPQPITTKPVVSLTPNYPAQGGLLVFFGTGKYVGASDITDDSVQSFYGIYDKGANRPVIRSDLEPQTITTVNSPSSSIFTKVRTVSNNKVNFNEKDGWRIDLPQAGERVVTNPRLADGRIIFTTFTPQSAVCKAGGESFLMVLDYATGGAFPQPEIDLNADGKLNKSDQINSENPAGIGLGMAYATSARLFGTPQGNISKTALVNMSSGAPRGVKLRGGANQRANWRQIR
jgi:type IV pilus assembly protein PilY1